MKLFYSFAAYFVQPFFLGAVFGSTCVYALKSESRQCVKDDEKCVKVAQSCLTL